MSHLPPAKPEEIGLDPERIQVAYDLLWHWTCGAKPAIPGGAILVARHGRALPPRFFGREGPAPYAEPIRHDGMFLLASLTKPITYLGAMILVERGLLSLSDTVTHYIPEFAAQGKENTLVSHLFTHTSGMPDMLPNNVELRRAHAPLEEFIRGAICDSKPLFPPGTNLSYQSMGTLVVAEIVQRLSGTSIHSFLKKEIFDPLGLKSTSLGARGFPAERLVRVDTGDCEGHDDFGWNSTYWRELGAPWGGMFSTPEDFAVICQLMLDGGRRGDVRLLAPHTVQLMTTNRLHDYPELPEPIRRCRPWGLGWQLNHRGASSSWSELLSRRAYGHIGATGTMAWIDPDRDGFCLLFTTAPHARAPWRLAHLSNAVAAAFL